MAMLQIRMNSVHRTRAVSTKTAAIPDEKYLTAPL
jgi:hypothetical protein